MGKVIRTLPLILGLLFSVNPGFAQKFQWANRAGGSGFDEGSSLGVDANGNSYVIGTFSNMATFGPFTLAPTPLMDAFSTDAVFMAKYNPQGQAVWAKKVSDSNLDFGKDITVDIEGNIYLTGGFSGTARFGTSTLISNGFGDMFVAKYNPEGDLIWVQNGGGASFTIGHGISVDTEGNSYVTGYFRATAVFGSFSLTSSGRDDIFVLKYDSKGSVLWAKNAGGRGLSGSAVGTGIAVAPNGGCYVTGFFYGATTFGAVALPGNTDQGLNKDIFLTKFDADGKVLWAKQISNPLEDTPGGLAVDQAGNCYITGSFLGTATFNSFSLTSNGAEDAFVAKYDPAGNTAWVKNVGGPANDTGNDIAIQADGSIFVTGTFSGNALFQDTTLTSQGESDLFVTKWDVAGQEIFTVRAGGPSQDKVNKIALDLTGNAYITGNFKQISYFGDIALHSRGDADIFIAKFGQPFNEPQQPVITINFQEDFDFCAGPEIFVPFRTSGFFNPDNSFAVQLSDATGSFLAPVTIGTGAGSPIKATIPDNTPPGPAYQIRVVSTSPVVESNVNDKALQITTVDLASSAPNIITPNGDGLNDTFVLNIPCQGIKLTVYNRWGEKVYEQAKYQNAWDGANLPEGVYYYHLLSDKNLNRKGWVEIMR